MQKWEYCVLQWEGDAKGQHRAALFSHQATRDKPDGTLGQMLARLGDDGWEAVNMIEPPRASGWLAFPFYGLFKRPQP